MNDENESGGCCGVIIGLIVIGIMISIGLFLLPYILSFVGVLLVIGAVSWFFSIGDSSPPTKQKTTVNPTDNQFREKDYRNKSVPTSRNLGTSQVSQNRVQQNNPTINYEQMERSYSRVFANLASLMGEKDQYHKVMNDNLAKKRSRVTSQQEYLDVMYKNVAYSFEMSKQLIMLLERYHRNGYPGNYEQFDQDYERLENTIKSNIDSLASKEKERYERKCKTEELKLEALNFDYGYWFTLQQYLNGFMLVLIAEVPEVRKMFMTADFAASKQMIDKYSKIQTNILMDNIVVMGAPKIRKEFNVAGVSYRTSTVYNAVNYLASITAGFQEYKGYNFERIRTSRMIIPKYKDLVSNDFQLILEPENEYDPYAIKVIIGNKYHVGYIPRESNKEIFDYLTKPNRYSYSGTVEVIGGPAKKYDYSRERVITDSSFNIGFKINLAIIER